MEKPFAVCWNSVSLSKLDICREVSALLHKVKTPTNQKMLDGGCIGLVMRIGVLKTYTGMKSSEMVWRTAPSLPREP